MPCDPSNGPKVNATPSGKKIPFQTWRILGSAVFQPGWPAGSLLVAKRAQRMDTARPDCRKTHGSGGNAQHDRSAYRKHRSIEWRDSWQIVSQHSEGGDEKRHASEAAGGN